ncbi:MAG: pantetheine-phosphate adenylyltransferase [Patescibacteria group bacterium]
MPAQHAIIGGTFDRLHPGHHMLLAHAFMRAERVTIGIAESELYQDKDYAEVIEDYATREQTLKNYLAIHQLLDRTTLIPITDQYGTTLTDPSIDVIIVSPATEETAKKINTERKNRQLPEMQIVVVPFVKADDGEPVSSERIRQGIIDQEGTSYLKFFVDSPEYILPENLREMLKQPVGEVTRDIETIKAQITDDTTIITIGDIVSLALRKTGIPVTLSILDKMTHREPMDTKELDIYFPQADYTISNPAGTINKDFGPLLVKAIENIIPQVMFVDGEEDLLALPSIMLAPLGALVIYGQINLGMVVVRITDAKKNYARHLLSLIIRG